MKRLRGDINVWAIVSVVALAFIGLVVFLVIDDNNKAVDYSKYDFNTVIGPSADNGNIGDHVKGDADAPTLIFEYADYQCPGCASINPRVNKAVEESDGKLAIVYRSFLLPYHQNGTAAASAVEAAGLQGYWKQYADKIFANQGEWEKSSASKRTEQFETYFEEVTEGKGDLEQFRKDLASNAVSRKINFDMGIGKRVDIEGTPAFYVEGQLIDTSKASSVVIDDEVVSWDAAQSGDAFVELLKRIAEVRAKK